MTRTSPLLIGIVLMIGVPAWSQTPTQTAATPLTLSDAIAKAMETSHRLAEARARQESAEAAVQVRRVADQPTLAVSGGYTRTNHVDPFLVPQPIGLPRVIYPDIPDNYFTRMSFQWPIYTGGRTDALERAASAEARASAQDIETTRADLRLEVVRVYWALATAGESVRVLEEALGRADAHLRDVRSRFDAGLIPPNDVSSVEAQRSREELQLIEARNIRQSLAEDLKRLTGVNDDIAIAERLEAAPAATADASAASRSEQRAIAERITAADERIQRHRGGPPALAGRDGGGRLCQPEPADLPARGQLADVVGARASWRAGTCGTADALPPTRLKPSRNEK